MGGEKVKKHTNNTTFIVVPCKCDPLSWLGLFSSVYTREAQKNDKNNIRILNSSESGVDIYLDFYLCH